MIAMTVLIDARVREQHLRTTAERDATVMIHITKKLCPCPRTTSAVPKMQSQTEAEEYLH
jgi:hypothetical protein